MTIVVGSKTEGEEVEDIDLLVIGQFAPGQFLPDHSLPDVLRGQPFEIRDFVFTLEVKAHDPSRIRLVKANNIEVRYANGGWKNATEQAINQKFALKNWVGKKLGIGCPRISHVLWLKNVPASAMPDPPRHVLFADGELADLLAMLDTKMFGRAAQQGVAIVTSIIGRDRGNIGQIRAYFQRELQLGKLDRRKLERICERLLQDQGYIDKLGQQLLVFQGRGGTGKTMRLLNLMQYLCRERRARVLFLTYNKSLVQDIRRLMHILDISESRARMQTTDSFMLALCNAMELSPEKNGNNMNWSDFAAKKAEAARRLAGQAPGSVRDSELAQANPDLFGWDMVLIDEGQDWPVAEKSAVLSAFGHKRIVVADGVDQFVQSARRADWASGVPTAERQFVSLTRSLRLKANLCRFALGFAREMGLDDWSLEIDSELAGGTVKVFLRPYGQRDHHAIFSQHESAGNAPIDALHCISSAPSRVHKDYPAELQNWGARVWDGSVNENRSHFPSDLAQHRIVKYQSCRGLEGWTVICLDLDCFYEEQVRHAPKPDNPDLLVDASAHAKRHAARWCLIPFTRAIDTLVLHASEGSELGQALVRVSRAYPDFVEIVR